MAKYVELSADEHITLEELLKAAQEEKEEEDADH